MANGQFDGNGQLFRARRFWNRWTTMTKNLDYGVEKFGREHVETRSLLRLPCRHDNVTRNYNRSAK